MSAWCSACYSSRGRLANDELAQMLGGDHAGVRTADALAALDRDGLAHRHDGLAWPTRALELHRLVDAMFVHHWALA
jgi:hypothetical protein